MARKSIRINYYWYLFVLLAIGLMRPGMAAELTLGVNLGLSQQNAARQYKPMVDYLARATGQKVRLAVAANALAHWEMMRREGYDMVLDNPAFTAYRAAKMGYTVIGKLPDVLSFTLVTNADEMMFEPSELIGRKVASLPSPAMTALRLEELYPNPMRQPNYIRVETHLEALLLVVNGYAAGAMVPTSMVAGYPNLNPVHTTEQLPAPGFSVSDRVSPMMRDTIRRALMDAHNTPAGAAMLEALNVPYFETATNATYVGSEHLLAGLFGY